MPETPVINGQQVESGQGKGHTQPPRKVAPSHQPKPEASQGSAGGFLKHTLGASTVILAWLFVVGWTYLHTYFAYFGINIASLDFSFYAYFTEVFTQLVSDNTHGVWLGVLIIALFALTWLGDRVVHKAAGVGIGIAVLLLFWTGFELARWNASGAAKRDIEEDTTILPVVSIEEDTAHSYVSGDIALMLQSPYLRLLWETKDTLFVFVPVSMNQPQVVVRVVALDRSKVLASLRAERIK